jgi:hypothetical protein
LASTESKLLIFFFTESEKSPFGNAPTTRQDSEVHVAAAS